MKKIPLILTIMLMLQGCIAAAIVGGAAVGVAGGVIVYDQRSTQTILDDKDIGVKAQDKINNDQELKGKVRATVAVFNYVVLLVGQAPTQELRDHAVKLVNSVSKVKVVHDEMTIGYPISSSTQTHDAWLTTKVKSALLAEKGLKSTQLKIVTEDSVVYLMGLVTRSQANLATEKVRQIEDVKKVVKLFEYVS